MSTPSTLVREADPRAEKAAILNVLTAELEGWTGAGKFDWLYLDNPFGEARCWVLEDANGALVGVSAAFPREMVWGSRRLRAWVLGDFCVSRRFRSLGPAVRLQRAAFDAVDRGGDVDLWYDFPSKSMQAVYRRIGDTRRGELVRMVYLIKADRAMARRVGNPALARGLSSVGNVLLGSRAALESRDADVTLRSRDADFDGSPPRGFQIEDGVSLHRSSEYLNWRYRDDPRGAPSILDAGGSGAGSIVYRGLGDDFEIVDVFGVDTQVSLKELVFAVVDEARAHDAESVTVSISSEHSWAAVLRSLGFHSRDSQPFVSYSRVGVFARPAPWFVLGGDRDLY